MVQMNSPDLNCILLNRAGLSPKIDECEGEGIFSHCEFQVRNGWNELFSMCASFVVICHFI